MRSRPAFFDEIQRSANSDWEQLEANPRIAGPWWQMFRQVQSPRHVLSELLQNADDARATWVKVRLRDSLFTFEHNGEDFDRLSLQSLCSFGNSNKRNLQTIGFRGLGFKSTFSYGERVEVLTPTLAFAFEKKRFTRPVWLNDAPAASHTLIRIQVTSRQIWERITEDIQRWQENTIPLLFFRSITSLDLQDESFVKEALGEGPTPGSCWYELRGRQTRQVLHVVSDGELFPADALQEIRQERDSIDFALPPARVEIICEAGADRRIYSVLPTEVRPPLPFSCNAPFLQDPARTGIKDPTLSPTNRWLLRRVGELTASTFLGWLGNRGLSLAERAEAYDLLGEIAPKGNSLDAECARSILWDFQRTIGSRFCLLA